jgi:glycosyltransferase involved in cell wall biosynthesis
VLASLSYGDAISNEALVIRRHLRRAGYASDIFAESVEPRLSKEARPLSEYDAAAREAVCLFHFSIGGEASRLAFHARRLVVLYHNITPAESFAPFHPHLARLCHEGRRELQAFASRAELGLADSEYNRSELEAAGYPRTAVLPIVLDLDTYRGRVAPIVKRLYGPDRRNVVFVGRVIPAKRIEDLLRTFAVLQRHVEKKSRLLIVGDYRGHERYLARLLALRDKLKLRDVVFTGRVEDDDLRGYFQAADVFLGLSAHEGFCVPVLEAMLHGVPVVAYDAGAVGETMGGAGVLLKERSPEVVAEVVGAVLHDPALQQKIKAGQERRVEKLRTANFGAMLTERLAPVLAS